MSVVFENGSQRERTLLAVGAGASLLGIALSVGQQSSLASGMTLLGLLGLIIGLHRFGRSGPDAPTDSPRKPAKRRTRKPRKSQE